MDKDYCKESRELYAECIKKDNRQIKSPIIPPNCIKAEKLIWYFCYKNNAKKDTMLKNLN